MNTMRWLIVWYGPDQRRHQDDVHAGTELDALAELFRRHPCAESARIVQAFPEVLNI